MPYDMAALLEIPSLVVWLSMRQPNDLGGKHKAVSSAASLLENADNDVSDICTKTKSAIADETDMPGPDAGKTEVGKRGESFDKHEQLLVDGLEKNLARLDGTGVLAMGLTSRPWEALVDKLQGYVAEDDPRYQYGPAHQPRPAG